jgi:hypothetical protein
MPFPRLAGQSGHGAHAFKGAMNWFYKSVLPCLALCTPGAGRELRGRQRGEGPVWVLLQQLRDIPAMAVGDWIGAEQSNRPDAPQQGMAVVSEMFPERRPSREQERAHFQER